MNRFRFLSALSIFLLAALASLQAQIRDPIPEIASERFEFREGRHTFSIPCNSTIDLNNPTPGIRHLIIMVHGLDRKPHYHKVITDTVESAGVTEGVAVISPQFLALVDVEHHGLPTEVPYWSVNGWVIGHNSRNDEELPRPARVSSFTVVDEILLRALKLLPDLESVAIAGFSAGGQFMNRYAAGTMVHNSLTARGLDVVYVVGAPSSYLYLCQNRVISSDPLAFGPVSQSEFADCANFNVYRMGLDDMNQYMQRTGAKRIREQYGQRAVVYICGGKDDASASRNLATGCAAMLQGSHRVERAIFYHQYMAFFYGPDVHQRHTLLIAPEAAHNSRQLFVTPEGIQAVLGNFRR